MKNHIFYFSFILLLGFTNCQKKSQKQEPTPQLNTPGYFVMNAMHLQKKGETILKKSSSNFDLGEIKASKSYYFILTNGGTQPIFDIHLFTNDSAFEISPKYIQKIENGLSWLPGNGAGLIPIVNLGVTHGKNLSGLGYTKVLPMGSNKIIISAYGKTLNASNDTVDVFGSFECDVFARLMDINFYHANNLIDLTRNYGYTIGGDPIFEHITRIRNYPVWLDTMHIENTGNVTIDLTYGTNSISIPSGIKQHIPITKGMTYFKLNGGATITNHKKIDLGNDGNGYFCLTVQ